MVGRLQYFAHDPNGKSRGAGHYWHRGNGVYSKQSDVIDGAQWHKRKKVRNVKKAEEEVPHKHDYKTKSRSSHSKTKRVPSGRVRGFF